MELHTALKTQSDTEKSDFSLHSMRKNELRFFEIRDVRIHAYSVLFFETLQS